MIDLSIVIPVRNEQARLDHCMLVALPLADRHNAEIILIENGSQDRTWQICQHYASDYRSVVHITRSQPGKGAAVRAGLLMATGPTVLVTDSDWSVPPEMVCEVLEMRNQYDVIIGDREHPMSQRLGEPWRRHVSGRVFNLLTQAALPEMRGLRDTQCGFKAFRAPVARGIARAMTIQGWAWDIEVLYLARRLGLRLGVLPVIWQYDGNSRVRLVRDALAMVREVAQIRRNQRAGAYQFGGYDLDVIAEV